MPPVVQKLRQAPALRWFLLAALLLLLFLAYTAILTSGALDTSTAQVEYRLLGRPITRVDCLFYAWRNLGRASITLVLIILLGGVCLLLGYRWTVVPYLLILLFICLVCEVVGKSVLTQPLPRPVNFDLSVLSCPQIHNQPASVRLSAAAGIWWNLPPPSQQLIEQIHLLAQRPSNFGGDVIETSYPGGHAMRCSFLGGLAAWLCWRHIKRQAMRVPAMLVIVVAFFSIGLMQFYLGVHLITDTIAGYLFGMAAACCAIGLLLVNSLRQRAHSRGGAHR